MIQQGRVATIAFARQSGRRSVSLGSRCAPPFFVLFATDRAPVWRIPYTTVLRRAPVAAECVSKGQWRRPVIPPVLGRNGVIQEMLRSTNISRARRQLCAMACAAACSIVNGINSEGMNGCCDPLSEPLPLPHHLMGRWKHAQALGMLSAPRTRRDAGVNISTVRIDLRATI
ncbi:conserved hypothetical protein [Mesorhizobium prunaredense]|uniref:Uncharacterized protein n=1 Tax=Mesorhizobium prunaredense TaxID=1631249 RepID=A0A1R3V7Q7_9HYPH|nr:conserved hypothetical protein [Mesorhizobium prunaredense]